jgi:RecA-family ATPase
LIDLIAEVARQTDKRVVLVVIDTLARAMAGGNENASEDMGAFVRNVDRVRSATSAHTMIVHHSGKNKAAGARGHSSLRAATDTEIEIDQRIVTNSVIECFETKR